MVNIQGDRQDIIDERLEEKRRRRNKNVKQEEEEIKEKELTKIEDENLTVNHKK